MYILIQDSNFENHKEINYHVQAPELEKEYTDAGYERGERSYKVKYQHREYTVICQEFRSKQESQGNKHIVLIPDFLIPGRPYPIQAYLFAINTYSNNPDMGQREAAEITRKHFGLKTFAHTTLGRALKRLAINLEEAAKATGGKQENKTPDVGTAGRDEEEKQMRPSKVTHISGWNPRPAREKPSHR